MPWIDETGGKRNQGLEITGRLRCVGIRGVWGAASSLSGRKSFCGTIDECLCESGTKDEGKKTGADRGNKRVREAIRKEGSVGRMEGRTDGWREGLRAE